MAGIAQPTILGRERAMTAEIESTYDTYVKPTAGGSFVAMNHSFTPNYERLLRRDALPNARFLVERYEGRQAPEWEVQTFLLPRGGDPVDVGPLLTAAFGNEDDQGASVLYDHSSDPCSVSLTALFGATYMEAVSGALVMEYSVEYNGTDAPTHTFSGPAARHIMTATSTTTGANGTATLNGNVVTSADLVLQDGESRNFEVGSVVKVAADTNGGAGYEVVAVNHATHTITVETTLSASDNDAVVPFSAYDDTLTGGSPISAVSGQLDFGNDSLGFGNDADVLIQSASFTLNNNWQEVGPMAFRRTRQDNALGFGEVTGEIGLFGRRSELIRLGRSKIFGNTMSMKLLFGTKDNADNAVISQGTNSFLYTFNDVEFDPAAVDIPEAEMATMTLPFVAKASSRSANDAVTLRTK